MTEERVIIKFQQFVAYLLQKQEKIGMFQIVPPDQPRKIVPALDPGFRIQNESDLRAILFTLLKEYTRNILTKSTGSHLDCDFICHARFDLRKNKYDFHKNKKIKKNWQSRIKMILDEIHHKKSAGDLDLFIENVDPPNLVNPLENCSYPFPLAIELKYYERQMSTDDMNRLKNQIHALKRLLESNGNGTDLGSGPLIRDYGIIIAVKYDAFDSSIKISNFHQKLLSLFGANPENVLLLAV